MYSSDFIRLVVREAKKSSIIQAARKFEVAYMTVKKWLDQKQKKKELRKLRSGINNAEIADSHIKNPHLVSEGRTTTKLSLFRDHCSSLQPFEQVAVKFIRLNSSNPLPAWLITAYDLKSGCLNFCFTAGTNKSSKALYLLYVNSFLLRQKIPQPGFISELKLVKINTCTEKMFDRMVSNRIKKLIRQLESIITAATDIPELLIKSYIFLADYNLSRQTAGFLHPPFVLDGSMAAFDFTNNTLMLNGLNEKIRVDVLNITQKYHQENLQLTGFNNEKLLKIYNYFTGQGLTNRLLEDKIVHDAGNLQLMGELSRSDLLLKTLLNNKNITNDGRNSLYIGFGLQKYHIGDYSAAIRYYKKTITGCRLDGNQQLEFTALNLICNLYLQVSKNDKAYRYLRLAQRLANKLNDSRIFAKFFYLSGFYYFSKGDYQQSGSELEQAIAFSKKNSTGKDYTLAVTGFANLLVKMKRYKKALKYARKALSNNLKVGLKVPICQSHLRCAHCYFGLGDYMAAETNLQACLKLLSDVNYPVVDFAVRELYTRLLLVSGRRNEAEQLFEWLKNFYNSHPEIPQLPDLFREVELIMLDYVQAESLSAK